MAGWYSFNDQMKRMFGGKVYKLSLSAGCTCPNRDGTLSSGGCIFCGSSGSGDFAASGDILSQIEEAKLKVSQKIGRDFSFAGYMAYFQPYTNTYGDTKRLAALFEEAISLPEILALSVATRPDCLKEDMVDALADINSRKPVFVELGLQTVHQDTAKYINRCYGPGVFDDAFARLKKRGIRVVAHVIIGLPGEDAIRTKETVKYLSGLSRKADASAGAATFLTEHLDGVKFSLLYVLKNTGLSKLVPENPGVYTDDRPGACPRRYIKLKDGQMLPQYSLEEYATLVNELIRMLPEDTAVHRVTGDPPWKELLIGGWITDKKRVLNTIRGLYV